MKQIVFTSGLTLQGRRAPRVNVPSAESWRFLRDGCQLKTQTGCERGDLCRWGDVLSRVPMPCSRVRTQDPSKRLSLRQLDWRPERSLVIQGCWKRALIASRPGEISVLLPELSVKEGEEQASAFFMWLNYPPSVAKLLPHGCVRKREALNWCKAGWESQRRRERQSMQMWWVFFF